MAFAQDNRLRLEMDTANFSMLLGGRSVSFDYFVAVHNDKWPTAKAVQTALSRTYGRLSINAFH
jgi:hypothetical protein